MGAVTTPAIVVGMSGSTGLAVVRALARAGVACHAVHYDAAAPALATRHARAHVSPDWRREPASLVEFLVTLARELDPGREAAGGAAAPPAASLFVCHDAALDAVWAADERLRAAGLRPAFTSRRPLAELLDKRTQMEAAARAGVATPWTRWGTAAEIAEWADDCPYPAILKPAFSHLGVAALGAKALRCASPDEVRAALAGIGDVEVLLQEYVPGDDDELYTAGLFVCGDGHVAFTGRKLKQHPPSLGIARLTEAVDEPALIPGSVALLAELGYEGISQVEYKRDPRDGSHRLMEANLRPWTWIGLATACGVNLPLAAYFWSLGDEARGAIADAPRDGQGRQDRAAGRPRRWVWLVPEAVHTLRDLRRGVRPRAAQWRGLCAEAFFSRDDPAPLLRVVEQGVRAKLPVGGSLGAVRRARSLVGKGLVGVAAALNAGVLWAEWRRAGRRSVTGARPAVGLPAPGAALVLAPHPDDETIMCGATLAALRARGDHVRVVAVTAGEATAVDLTAVSAGGAPATPAAEIGGVRAAELQAACAALGVDDVASWDFADRGVSPERARLAARIGEELDASRPAFVFVPFPYDGHADHVAVALALADALARDLESGAADQPALAAPTVLCGAAQMPFSPGWPTRLIAAGGTWAARREATAAYASRGRRLFVAPTQRAYLHPARPLRANEAFVELPARGYVDLARALEADGLTVPGMRGGGHPIWSALGMLRTRRQRDAVAALLRSVVSER